MNREDIKVAMIGAHFLDDINGVYEFNNKMTIYGEKYRWDVIAIIENWEDIENKMWEPSYLNGPVSEKNPPSTRNLFLNDVQKKARYILSSNSLPEGWTTSKILF